jgi:hypothetical protein
MSRFPFHRRAMLSAAGLMAVLLATACNSDALGPSQVRGPGDSPSSAQVDSTRVSFGWHGGP